MDIATKKKSRWLRGIDPPQVEVPELDRLLDFYWSGPERRISMLTVRIIGMNAIAMILLMIGILSLAQYEQNLITAKLESFDTEIHLIAESLAESAIEDENLNVEKARSMLRRLAASGFSERIRVFDGQNDLILDTKSFDLPPIAYPVRDSRYGLDALKDLASFILDIIPDRDSLESFPTQEGQRASDFPGLDEARKGIFSLGAWRGQDDFVLLSGSAPLAKNGDVRGTVLLTRNARDINEKIGDMWLNIVVAFFITLVMTILVSIYLSGAITAPLRKLAKAADGVRKGKLSVDDIPNLSERNDEIGELSVALRDMMNALWNRMDTIERFSADVAHELKNPLTSLKSAVETAGIVKKKQDREKMMEIIRHDIERMDRLISDISHASRLDSELSRDVFERVNMREVIENLLDIYIKPLGKKAKDKSSFVFEGVRITFEDYYSGIPYVWGLENRLEQVFQNLLANALSFSEKGSEITIGLYQNQNLIRLVIEDEGPGIPEKNLNKIFERFYTERPSHESYGNHSGLGLSICKQIIKAMNGEIFAENIKDENGAADTQIRGARFTVILKTL